MGPVDRQPTAGSRRPLTRERVLHAALELVDRDGSEALTMRRLGRELGIAAMSIYNHVAGREELLDGLSEVMVAEIGVEAGEVGDPRSVLRRFAHGIRAVALAHPDAFRLVGMRPLRTSAAYEPVEVALAALRAVGLSADEAAHAYRLLVSFARGFALAEISGFTFERGGGGEPTGLGPEQFPSIVALASQLERPSADAAFEFGTELILDGLEARGVAG
ncbi:MAG TPA: TetR/AcrR family transcriptional regulator C-terminal domain-containing protein [Solirubrobacterales bacterium]|nr:TetR/AcrR family transcriptional regulator C-terminal domain-containing protein [Solirubrobacterales bacterium]